MSLPSLAVLCLSSANAPKAKSIAGQLDVPLFLGAPLGTFDFLLTVTDERVELRATTINAGPVFVDFNAGALDFRRRYGGEGGQMILKAVGGPGKSVLDATAGLASDAFILASLGVNVTAVERSPAVAVLVADALERAGREIATHDIVKRIELLAGESREVMASSKNKWDAIYLDPMFPEKKKTALPKKELRVLQELLGTGDDEENQELFKLAVKTAGRVVVKRPLRAPELSPGVSHALKGKSIRFDVYINQ